MTRASVDPSEQAAHTRRRSLHGWRTSAALYSPHARKISGHPAASIASKRTFLSVMRIDRKLSSPCGIEPRLLTINTPASAARATPVSSAAISLSAVIGRRSAVVPARVLRAAEAIIGWRSSDGKPSRVAIGSRCPHTVVGFFDLQQTEQSVRNRKTPIRQHRPYDGDARPGQRLRRTAGSLPPGRVGGNDDDDPSDEPQERRAVMVRIDRLDVDNHVIELSHELARSAIWLPQSTTRAERSRCQPEPPTGCAAAAERTR